MHYDLYNIDGVDIPFDRNWKNIAISLSGGADSALLSYILCSLATEHQIGKLTLHCISHTRMWKTRPWQQYDSLKVFNWLKNRFPNIDFIRHTNFIAPAIEFGNIGASIKDEYGKLVSGDIIEIQSFAEYICHHNQIESYYNAVTRNPKDVDFKGMDSRDIDPTDNNKHLSIMKHMGKLACHPFRFTEKNWVIRQYKRLNIEELLHSTRSCEGEFAGINYITYQPNQFVPLCRECFWCKEREWAIEQNK